MKYTLHMWISTSVSKAGLEANVSLSFFKVIGSCRKLRKIIVGVDSPVTLPRDPLSSIGFLSRYFDTRQVQL